MPHLPPSLLRWHAAADPTVTFEHTAFDPLRGIVLVADARVGEIIGPEYAETWSQAVPSWQAAAPTGTAIEICLRARVDDHWTRWYSLGSWSEDPAQRHSVPAQSDADADVATDTLLLHQPAHALQWRVVLRGADEASPAVRCIAVALAPQAEVADTIPPRAVGPLPVPELSQMLYPGGGPVWCSPTSLTMLLGYWAGQTDSSDLARFTDPHSVSEIVAPAVYDSVYDGTGNWPFNTAFAATIGLEGYVLQLQSLSDVADLLAAGVPVVASIAWEPGMLDGAPIARSSGHLVVIVGLTEQGDVIVNDPRADTRQGEAVQRVYRREQFLQVWAHSKRTVYLVFPPGHLTS